MDIAADPEIRKVDMRSKEGRAMKAAQVANEAAEAAPPQRLAARQSARTPSREPIRQPARGGEVVGRNGEVLRRTRTSVGDAFEIPAYLRDPNYDMQWNAVSIIGNTEVLSDQNLMMHQNGWRPVPAERFAGKILPAGSKGSILRGGQRLDERPMSLSIQAREEDIRNAKQLLSDRNESLKLAGVKNQMGDGFEMSRKYRGTGGDIRMSIDPGLDIPAASHTLAEPGE